MLHHTGWNDVDSIWSAKIFIQLVFDCGTGIELSLRILYWMLYKEEIHRDSEFLISLISCKRITINHRTVSWRRGFNLKESNIARISFDQQIRQAAMKVFRLMLRENLIRLPLNSGDFFCRRYTRMRSKNALNPRFVVQAYISTGLDHLIKLIPETPIKAGSESYIHRLPFSLDV